MKALDRSAARNRSRLDYKIVYAFRYPGRVLPYCRRWLRDVRFGLRHNNAGGAAEHVGYYRQVMHSNVAVSAEKAVGADDHTGWLSHGQMQFDYLCSHGLEPTMRMLEIGCGNLRAGRLFIDYLEPGNYYGIDISPDILVAALDTVATFGLQDKLPRLTLVSDLKFGFLPEAGFDVVNAHSVFSHSPIEVIAECVANVARLLAPNGFFDFTFNATSGTEHQVLREDFFYRPETLIALAAEHDLDARLMDDWRKRSPQSKLRLTSSTPAANAGE